MRTLEPKLSFAFRLLEPNPREPPLRMRTSEPIFRSALMLLDPKRKPGRLSIPTFDPMFPLALKSLEPPNPKSQSQNDPPRSLRISTPELKFPFASMLLEPKPRPPREVIPTFEPTLPFAFMSPSRRTIGLSSKNWGSTSPKAKVDVKRTRFIVV